MGRIESAGGRETKAMQLRQYLQKSCHFRRKACAAGVIASSKAGS